ncbi:UNVERIFIED_CONTAM: hypothetical protein Sradi_7065300 [Sesamum radiatum]|uniref:Reverse transcriptase zinc-binding domain-containing protein n=1 Tax=Sesamum radiatum TaxID=300843 RepID=A0AAW2J5G5_SESRA
MRDFLWKGVAGRGYAKVSWDHVCRSKVEGGLGLRKLLHVNQALMLKQIWRLLQRDKQSIWVAWVLVHRLQNQTVWTAKVGNAPWYWRKLVKLCSIFRPGLMYRVGDGSMFKLWLDLWHVRGPLITAFPRGPAIMGLPSDSLLQEVLQHGQWAWPSVTDFDINEIISSLPPTHPGESDTILWVSNSGKFPMAAALQFLQPSSPLVPWFGLLEGKFKIPRHNFILWLAIKERLSTLDRLWLGQQGLECVLCDDHASESHFHLFFNCSYSKRCLAVLRRVVRFCWPGIDWQTAILWASRRWRGTHLMNAAARALLAALVYHIWSERNNRRYNCTASSVKSLALRVIEVVRLRIISANIRPCLQLQILYRVWRIPWHGNANNMM